MGGVALGEMLHRLSIEVYDAGLPFSFLISPMDGIMFAVTGRQKQQTHQSSISIMDISAELGSIVYSIDADDVSGQRFPFTVGSKLNLVYLDKEGLSKKIPFSTFNLKVQGEIAYEYYSLSLFSNGPLFYLPTFYTDNTKLGLTVNLHYDAIFNESINFSSNAIGFSLLSDTALGHDWNIKAGGHVNWVVLGASEYYYLKQGIIDPGTDEENRLYASGMGANLKLHFSVAQPVFGKFALNYMFYIMRTIQTKVGGS